MIFTTIARWFFTLIHVLRCKRNCTHLILVILACIFGSIAFSSITTFNCIIQFDGFIRFVGAFQCQMTGIRSNRPFLIACRDSRNSYFRFPTRHSACLRDSDKTSNDTCQIGFINHNRWFNGSSNTFPSCITSTSYLKPNAFC